MTSNFFTKPFGLQPTPSACFAPPEPGPGGDITGLCGYTPSPINIGQTGNYFWNFCNVNIPSGVPITVAWTAPGIAEVPPGPFTNCDPGGHTSLVIGPIGIKFGTAVVTWPSLQTRTYNFWYEISA